MERNQSMYASALKHQEDGTWQIIMTLNWNWSKNQILSSAYMHHPVSDMVYCFMYFFFLSPLSWNISNIWQSICAPVSSSVYISLSKHDVLFFFLLGFGWHPSKSKQPTHLFSLSSCCPLGHERDNLFTMLFHLNKLWINSALLTLDAVDLPSTRVISVFQAFSIYIVLLLGIFCLLNLIL